MITPSKEQALEVLSLIDLTSLNNDDTPQQIVQLCKNATIVPDHPVAAVCVYPMFVPIALEELYDKEVAIATVVNFPYGTDDADAVLYQTKAAITAGADEIDLVMPYEDFLTGQHSIAAELVQRVKEVCDQHSYHDILLKVILESGIYLEKIQSQSDGLEDEILASQAIREATHLAIVNGADFVKTSTGKVRVNATLDSAKVILSEIRRMELLGCGARGFKAAGGIKTVPEAVQYLDLARQIMGNDWIDPINIRLGASSLLNDVLNVLGIPNEQSGHY